MIKRVLGWGLLIGIEAMVILGAWAAWLEPYRAHPVVVSFP
jgi:hypothetical protein